MCGRGGQGGFQLRTRFIYRGACGESASFGFIVSLPAFFGYPLHPPRERKILNSASVACCSAISTMWRASTPTKVREPLDWTLGRQHLLVGLSPTPTIDLIESIWGLRYLARTPMDLQGVASRGTGISREWPSQHLRHPQLSGHGEHRSRFRQRDQRRSKNHGRADLEPCSRLDCRPLRRL